jgi:hypothetical protein
VVGCTNQAYAAANDPLLCGFNLIPWTKQLILKVHGIDFNGFFTATFAALLIGKAVQVTDNLPFIFDGALDSTHPFQNCDLLDVRVRPPHR